MQTKEPLAYLTPYFSEKISMKLSLITFAILGIFSCKSSNSMLPDDPDKPMNENSTDNPDFNWREQPVSRLPYR